MIILFTYFIILLLKYSRFTMLLVSGVQQGNLDLYSHTHTDIYIVSSSGPVVKNLPAMHESRIGRSDLWVGKIPWRRAWLPTPVFLPGERHGERRLEGYSPWGHKELDTTEVT